MKDAEKVAAHPEIVERIKKKAKENEDIPTKTAVISEINYEREKKRRKEAGGPKKRRVAIRLLWNR